jgi:hypothetical protein
LKNSVDLLFSSPPYFDTERYSTEDSQSWKKYRTVEDWLNRFLFRSLENAFPTLKRNAWIALNVADSGDRKICDSLCSFMNAKGFEIVPAWKYLLCSRPGCKSKAVGCGKIAEPIWLFRRFLE